MEKEPKNPEYTDLATDRSNLSPEDKRLLRGIRVTATLAFLAVAGFAAREMDQGNYTPALAVLPIAYAWAMTMFATSEGPIAIL